MSETTNKIERRSLADQVYARIKRMILSGELRAGERIPEERIAAEFEVSRTPIREAMRRLEEYGLVHLKPRSYAEVARVGADDADRIAEVRASLEGLGVRLLAEHATSEDCTELRALAAECDKLVKKGEPAAIFEIDGRLHLEIARRSGNPCLLEFMERLDAKVQLARLVKCPTLDHIAAAVAQHAPIIDAICAHDPDRAADLMAQHAAGTTPERNAPLTSDL
jgi:DNA-binding GntR family transcriptional regulator